MVRCVYATKVHACCICLYIEPATPSYFKQLMYTCRCISIPIPIKLFSVFVCNLWLCICAGTAQIVVGPASQVIPSGGTAVFNCSLACSSSPTPVTWYMTFPSNGRTLPVSQYTQISQIKSIYGIDVARASFDGCAQGGYRVEQLAISNAGMDLNLLPVQCSTLCFDGNCACQSVQVFFSKFAVLLITGTSIELYMYMRTYIAT